MTFAPRGLGGRLLLCALALASVPAAAMAQAASQPIGKFVFDARGAFPVYPHESSVAEPRDFLVSELPGWGLGFDVGAHVYPVRYKAITFGFGGSLLWTRRTRSQGLIEGTKEPKGPDVQTKLTAFSPQLSFNFGKRNGYSYLSGGLGSSTLAIANTGKAIPEKGEAIKTINYGGGGRWFTNDHMAFTFDIRFYAMNPQLPTENTAGHPRLTLVVFTAGVSFR